MDTPVDNSKPNFEKLWATCHIDTNRVMDVKKVVAKLSVNKHIYDEIAFRCACAWWVPAILHYRESSRLECNVYLHNGQRLGQTTTIVPTGIFFGEDQFIEAAEHALRSKKLNGIQDVPTFLPKAEGFNGFGYRKRIGDHGVVELSPYVWAATNHSDETGKYVRDGLYDPKAHEKQLGVAAILCGIFERYT